MESRRLGATYLISQRSISLSLFLSFPRINSVDLFSEQVDERASRLAGELAELVSHEGCHTVIFRLTSHVSEENRSPETRRVAPRDENS